MLFASAYLFFSAIFTLNLKGAVRGLFNFAFISVPLFVGGLIVSLTMEALEFSWNFAKAALISVGLAVLSPLWGIASAVVKGIAGVTSRAEHFLSTTRRIQNTFNPLVQKTDYIPVLEVKETSSSILNDFKQGLFPLATNINRNFYSWENRSCDAQKNYCGNRY
jgi:MFS family permease